jgi:hypothetical protein
MAVAAVVGKGTNLLRVEPASRKFRLETQGGEVLPSVGLLDGLDFEGCNLTCGPGEASLGRNPRDKSLPRFR